MRKWKFKKYMKYQKSYETLSTMLIIKSEKVFENQILDIIIPVLIKTPRISTALVDFPLIKIIAPTLCVWSFSCVTQNHVTHCTWKHHTHFLDN